MIRHLNLLAPDALQPLGTITKPTQQRLTAGQHTMIIYCWGMGLCSTSAPSLALGALFY